MLGALIGGGLSALGGLFGGGAEKKAARQNAELLNRLRKEGLSWIQDGYDGAQGYLQGAHDVWNPLAQMGQQGAQMYANAMGLGGADGTAAAQNAFQAGPGYQFQMDQGLQALERRAAAQGRLGSGQTGIDTMSYAQGLANQEYNNWLNNLSGYNSMWQNGLAGQAGSLADLANLETGTANQRVGLATGITNGLMGANNQYASGTQQQWAGGLGGLAQGLGGAFGGYL